MISVNYKILSKVNKSYFSLMMQYKIYYFLKGQNLLTQYKPKFHHMFYILTSKF